MDTVPSYGARQRQRWHLTASSTAATLCAAVMWLSTVGGEHLRIFAPFRWVFVPALLAVTVLRRSRFVVYACCVAAGCAGGAAAWSVPVVEENVPCAGVVRFVSDPSMMNGGARAIVEFQGKRLRASAYGVAGARMGRHQAGETVVMSGQCSPLSGEFVRYDRVRHVVGVVTIDEMSEESSEGIILLRSANRMRESLRAGVAHMDSETQSLFTGLVVGDDRFQPREMLERFRESGLSHLCAASGQNVSYLLALALPFLKEVRPRTKWLVTVFIICWFVILTRAEPSVLRAGCMAAAVATNAVRRHPMNARVVLALSVMTLLIVDPMLAWSVGFALSVGATAGLAWLSAPLGKICGGRGVLATTLAAQAGTLPIALLVFGSVPVVSLVANPFALPVAGAVMTVGLPLSLLASQCPPLVAPVSSLLSLPVAWVDGVAKLASQVSPSGALNIVLWVMVLSWLAWRWQRKKV